MAVNFFLKKCQTGGGARGGFGKRPDFFRIFICATFPNCSWSVCSSSIFYRLGSYPGEEESIGWLEPNSPMRCWQVVWGTVALWGIDTLARQLVWENTLQLFPSYLSLCCPMYIVYLTKNDCLIVGIKKTQKNVKIWKSWDKKKHKYIQPTHKSSQCCSWINQDVNPSSNQSSPLCFLDELLKAVDLKYWSSRNSEHVLSKTSIYLVFLQICSVIR